MTQHVAHRHSDEITRLTRDRDDWRGRYDLAAELAVKFSCERDDAIAQRDRAVAAGRAVIDAWTGPYWIISPLCDVLASIDTPIPDRLAADRQSVVSLSEGTAKTIISDNDLAAENSMEGTTEEYFEVFLRDYSDLSPVKHKLMRRSFLVGWRLGSWHDPRLAAERETGRRWRHVKRGTEYVEVGRAYLQTSRPVTDMTPVVVYKGDSGMWVRPGIEFEDGRFVEIAALRDTSAAPETGKTKGGET